MYYINPTGPYHGNPMGQPFPGCVQLPDDLLGDYLAAMGFVALTLNGNIVTALAVDQDALDAYQLASQPDISAVRAEKLSMISDACRSTILAGIDVPMSSGATEHFSLQEVDQINIDSMFTAVTLGATQYPYHEDDGKCVMYSATDIMTLYIAYKSYVTQQTTYRNFLKIWIEREEDRDVIQGIEYGSELPEDLAAEMTAILTAAKEQIEAIAAKITAA